MKKIKLTKGKYALVDNQDFEFLNQWKWHFLNAGYAARTIRMGKKFKKVLMHHILITRIIGQEVDHKNGNKLDNRKQNLRLCTTTQNHWNRGKLKTNKSGYKGVHWHKARQKWSVNITVNHKKYFLGYFTNKKKAATVYKATAKRFYKEFAYKG